MIYRIYFNTAEEAPFVWSVDEGTQESEQTVLAVIVLPPCVTTTHYSGEKRNTLTPIAWLEVSGELEIKDDVAYFS